MLVRAARRANCEWFYVRVYDRERLGTAVTLVPGHEPSNRVGRTLDLLALGLAGRADPTRILERTAF